MERAALAVLAGLAAEIARPLCRVGAATGGNTIRSIAAGLPTEIELQRTGLAARRGVILSRTGRPALGSSLVGREVLCPATTGQAARQASAIEQAVREALAIEPAVREASAIEPAVRISATEETEAQRAEQEAAISRAAEAETGMRLEAEDSTDPLHAPTATVVPPAWDLEGEVAWDLEEEAAAEAAVVVGVEAVGAGKRPTLESKSGGQK